VGDSDVDVQTAKAAGVPVILVSFGYEARRVRCNTPWRQNATQCTILMRQNTAQDQPYFHPAGLNEEP